MAREPQYPQDAAVGDADAGAPAAASEAARAAQAVKASGRTRHLVTGAALGIGSAALVAALLYARRGKGDKGGNG